MYDILAQDENHVYITDGKVDVDEMPKCIAKMIYGHGIRDFKILMKNAHLIKDALNSSLK